jgi:hypothetical protein
VDKLNSKDQTSPEISFLPLTEGLGFHPFSDGLPYAPVAKNPRVSPPANNNIGTGAIAAGPPKMVLPSGISHKRLDSVIPQISVPVVKSDLLGESKSSLSSAQKSKSTQQKVTFGYGYLLRRILAYWLDLIFTGGFCSVTLAGLVWIQEFDWTILFHPSVFLVVCLFFVAFHWSLMMIQEVVFKTTFGKRIFGLGLRGSGVLLFLRSIFFLPSAGLVGIGLFWSLFDRQKRCWHDSTVGIQPTEISRF